MERLDAIMGVVTAAVIVYIVVRGPDWLRRYVLVGGGAIAVVLALVLAASLLT